MPLILANQQRNVGYRRKLGGERRLGRNTGCGIRVELAIRWGARDAERLHITPRAVSAVTVVDSHGVPWKGKFRYAHRLLDAIPEPGRLPYLRAIVANCGPIAWGTHTGDLARRSDVLGVEPLQLDIQVIRVDSFLRCQLQAIGERIIPILDESLESLSNSQRSAVLRLPVLQKGRKPVFEMVAEAAKDIFISGRLEPANTRIFVLLLNEAEAQRSGQRIKQQNSNVDPFIADQI